MTENIVTNTQDVNSKCLLPVEEIDRIMETGYVCFLSTPKTYRKAPASIFEEDMLSYELMELLKEGDVIATNIKTKGTQRIVFAWNPAFEGGQEV